MIDLHCHILPDIDDGASDLSESLALLKLAVADGITHMVATPHINPGFFDNNPQNIQQVLSVLQQAAIAAEIPIKLSAAAEVRVTADLMAAVSAQQLPMLGRWHDQQVLLLEFPHSHIPPGSDKLVKWLLQRDILPMIAHPERNREVQADVAVLQPFIRAGCLFQLTASSILGDLGERHQACAQILLARRLFTIMATDCHNLNRRPPKLAEAVARVTQLTDDHYAHQLVYSHPATIATDLHFPN